MTASGPLIIVKTIIKQRKEEESKKRKRIHTQPSGKEAFANIGPKGTTGEGFWGVRSNEEGPQSRNCNSHQPQRVRTTTPVSFWQPLGQQLQLPTAHWAPSQPKVLPSASAGWQGAGAGFREAGVGVGGCAFLSSSPAAQPKPCPHPRTSPWSLPGVFLTDGTTSPPPL